MVPKPQHETKTRLLDAALELIRTKGYAGTSVDDICQQAGVTKGSFFHHFKSKDELALATVTHISEIADGLFIAAPYHVEQDPLVRLLGYVDFRAAILDGELYQYSCRLGTMVQETYATHPEIRNACEHGMSSHIAALLPDIEAAKLRYAPDVPWSVESVGYFMQTVLQGSFIFAKAKQGPDIARESHAHLRRFRGLCRLGGSERTMGALVERREPRRLRLGEGQVRALVADRAARTGHHAQRSGFRQGFAGDASHDDDEQNRHCTPAGSLSAAVVRHN